MTEKFLSTLPRCCRPAECLGKIPEMMVHKLVYWKRFTKKTLMIFEQEGSSRWGLKFLGRLLDPPLAGLSSSGYFPSIWTREMKLLCTSSNRKGFSGQLWWPTSFRESSSNASKVIASAWIGQFLALMPHSNIRQWGHSCATSEPLI